MLSYFRINDPYRLIAIAILLLLIRLPFYLFGDVMMDSDIRYFLLGEKIADGEWLYEHITTYESVLSGLFFGLLNLVFGKSLVAFHVITFLLVLVQTWQFNNMVTENRATENQSYLPGFFYALFISLFPESYTLTPILIGQTFLLIAMNYQFNHLEFRVKRDEKILTIGLCLGTYSLLLGPATVYMAFALLIFVLYTNTLFRRYLLMIFGFSLPYFLVWGVYLLKGYSGVFFESLLPSINFDWITPSSFLWMAALPAFYFLLFLPSSLFGRRFSNYQITINQSMFLWFVASILVFWLGRKSPAQSFILLGPLFGLYATHYFQAREGRGGFGFVLLFLLIVSLNLIYGLRPSWSERILGTSEKTEQKYADLSRGKNVLVLGPGFHEYREASHAGQLFDWEMSSEIFLADVDHIKISRVYKALKNDMPDLIIDENDLFGKYADQVPEFRKSYVKSGPVWVRSSN